MAKSVSFLLMYAFYFLAFQIEFFVVRWQVNEISGGVFWGITISMLHLAPVVAVGPLAGRLADRMNRRVLVSGGYAASALSLLLLWLALKAGVRIELVAVAVLFAGVANAFAQTALQSIFQVASSGMSVTRFVLIASLTVDASFFYAPLFIDAAQAAGLSLVSLVQLSAVITLVFGLYIFVVIPDNCSGGMGLGYGPRVARQSLASQEKAFLGVIGLIGVFLRPIFPVIPMMTIARPEMDLSDITKILTAVGVGTVIMSMLLVIGNAKRNVLAWVGTALGLAGLMVIVATAIPFGLAALLAWGAYGACCSVLFGLPRAWIQSNTPTDRIGTVSGAAFYLSRGGLLVGLPILGGLAELFDLITAMQFVSGLLVVFALPILRWSMQTLKQKA